MPSDAVNLTSFRPCVPRAFPFGATMSFRLMFSNSVVPYFGAKRVERIVWTVRSATDGSRLGSSDESGGGTRLIRAFQDLQERLVARLKELRRNLPLKLFSFLAGFYCATAFATVIGQTGDWDVLSAAFTVALIEGIGALMYKRSLSIADNGLDDKALTIAIAKGSHFKEQATVQSNSESQ